MLILHTKRRSRSLSMGTIQTTPLGVQGFESGTLTHDPLLATTATTSALNGLRGYVSGTLVQDPLLANVATTSGLGLYGLS